MLILKTKTALKKFVSGKSIGFVPTMGSLHQGHISLIEKSLQQNPCTVVSIFVNPKQFGPDEDYLNYPRDFNRDKKILKKLKVDAVFYPTTKQIYGKNQNNFHMYLGCKKLENLYCGKYRPGFFNGVLLIVLKFFSLIDPCQVYFGKKDYQQYFLIKRMVSDFDLNIKVHGLPTIRSLRGLAFSSRNKYLDYHDIHSAESIFQILKQAKSLVRKKVITNPNSLKRKIFLLFKKEKKIRIQYLEIVDKKTLLPALQLNKSIILFSGYVNQVRLIDNIEI